MDAVVQEEENLLVSRSSQKYRDKSRRSSILKVPGCPLEDIDPNAVEDVKKSSKEKKHRRSSGRRVSFAEKLQIKEFPPDVYWRKNNACESGATDENAGFTSSAERSGSEYVSVAEEITGLNIYSDAKRITDEDETHIFSDSNMDLTIPFENTIRTNCGFEDSRMDLTMGLNNTVYELVPKFNVSQKVKSMMSHQPSILSETQELNAFDNPLGLETEPRFRGSASKRKARSDDLDATSNEFDEMQSKEDCQAKKKFKSGDLLSRLKEKILDTGSKEMVDDQENKCSQKDICYQNIGKEKEGSNANVTPARNSLADNICQAVCLTDETMQPRLVATAGSKQQTGLLLSVSEKNSTQMAPSGCGRETACTTQKEDCLSDVDVGCSSKHSVDNVIEENERLFEENVQFHPICLPNTSNQATGDICMLERSLPKKAIQSPQNTPSNTEIQTIDNIINQKRYSREEMKQPVRNQARTSVCASQAHLGEDDLHFTEIESSSNIKEMIDHTMEEKEVSREDNVVFRPVPSYSVQNQDPKPIRVSKALLTDEDMQFRPVVPFNCETDLSRSMHCDSEAFLNPGPMAQEILTKDTEFTMTPVSRRAESEQTTAGIEFTQSSNGKVKAMLQSSRYTIDESSQAAEPINGSSGGEGQVKQPHRISAPLRSRCSLSDFSSNSMKHDSQSSDRRRKTITLGQLTSPLKVEGLKQVSEVAGKPLPEDNRVEQSIGCDGVLQSQDALSVSVSNSLECYNKANETPRETTVQEAVTSPINVEGERTYVIRVEDSYLNKNRRKTFDIVKPLPAPFASISSSGIQAVNDLAVPPSEPFSTTSMNEINANGGALDHANVLANIGVNQTVCTSRDETEGAIVNKQINVNKDNANEEIRDQSGKTSDRRRTFTLNRIEPDDSQETGKRKKEGTNDTSIAAQQMYLHHKDDVKQNSMAFVNKSCINTVELVPLDTKKIDHSIRQDLKSLSNSLVHEISMELKNPYAESHEANTSLGNTAVATEIAKLDVEGEFSLARQCLVPFKGRPSSPNKMREDSNVSLPRQGTESNTQQRPLNKQIAILESACHATSFQDMSPLFDVENRKHASVKETATPKVLDDMFMSVVADTLSDQSTLSSGIQLPILQQLVDILGDSGLPESTGFSADKVIEVISLILPLLAQLNENGQVDTIVHYVEDLVQKCKDLKTEIESVERLEEATVETEEAMTSTVDRLKIRNEQANDRKRFEQELASLQDSVETHEASIMQKRQDFQLQEKSITSLKSENKAIKENIEGAESEVCQLEAEIDRLRKISNAKNELEIEVLSKRLFAGERCLPWQVQSFDGQNALITFLDGNLSLHASFAADAAEDPRTIDISFSFKDTWTIPGRIINEEKEKVIWEWLRHFILNSLREDIIVERFPTAKFLDKMLHQISLKTASFESLSRDFEMILLRYTDAKLEEDGLTFLVASEPLRSIFTVKLSIIIVSGMPEVVYDIIHRDLKDRRQHILARLPSIAHSSGISMSKEPSQFCARFFKALIWNEV